MGNRQGLLRSALAVFTTLSLVMLLLPLIGMAALASSTEPVTVTGNPSCGDFTDGGTEFKIDATSDLTTSDSGTYTDGVLVVDLSIYKTGMGLAFDWSSNLAVDSVVAKGGPAGNLYRYDPAATGDTGLHSPLNPNSGEWYGLSHISLCYISGAETTSVVDTSTTFEIESSTTSLNSSTTTIESVETTDTTIRDEVLPTQLTTSSTTITEVSATEALPLTGMPASVWILGVSLLGAGVIALALARQAKVDED